MSERDIDQQEEELFGTGAVVARTGLTAARIRMWEKRYGAVEPGRSDTRRRLYTREDVERLALLRDLTEGGHAISRIAGLSLEQLNRLAEELEADRPGRSPERGKGRVLVISPAGEALLGEVRAEDFQWSCPFKALDEAIATPAVPSADLLLVETDTLFEETLEEAREVAKRCGAARTLIAYRFATREIEESVGIGGRDVVLLHGLRDAPRLRRECLFQLEYLAGGKELPDAGTVPERLFDANQLAKLSSIASAVDCECPRHIAELLKNLSAFEAYSEACEDRNSDDALVHAYLHRTTAQVRRTMEDALQHLLHAEGIDLKA